jgi:TusA-related sulfurtransferase
MAKEILNTTGIAWTLAMFKIASKAVSMQSGDILEVVGTHQTFEKDIRTWCERLHKRFLFMRGESEGDKRCQILF